MGLHRSAAVLIAVLTGLLLWSCTGHDAPVAPDVGVPVSLTLRPRFASAAAADDALPTNRIRLTARRAGTDEILATHVEDVDPNADEWTLALALELADGASLSVVVTIELINVVDGVETVQWSGVTEPISVGEGQQSQVNEVEVFRGPPENLSVRGLTITGGTTSIVEGDSTVFTAEVELSEPGVSPEVFWSSTDLTVARVDGGRVRALQPGSVRIVAAAGPAADTATLDVGPRPTRLVLDPHEAAVEELGAEVELTARVLDPRGDPVEGSPVVWSAVPEGVLEDLGGGRFRAASPGHAIVTAALEGTTQLRDSARVSVEQRIDRIVVTPEAATLTSLGEEIDFEAEVLDPGGSEVVGASPTWSSSRTSVASVDPASGLARALADGETTISATVEGVSGSAALTVEQRVATVEVTPAADTVMAVGATAAFSASASDAGGTPVEGATFVWSSDDPTVATVDQDGVATATGAGSALIAAESDGVTGTATLRVLTRADVAVTKTVDRADPLQGETVTFTVRATNLGPTDATGVRVEDVLPDGLSLVDARTSAGTYDRGTGIWEVGSLAAEGGRETLTLVTTAAPEAAGTTLTNVARSLGLPTQTDLDPTNDADSASVLVRYDEADVAVRKRGSASDVFEGDRVTFTVDVENLGPGTATELLVTDALPAGLSFVSATASQGAYDADTGVWTLGTVAPDGATRTLTLVAAVDSGTVGQTLTNTARSRGPGDLADPVSANDADSASVTVGEKRADLAVSKSASTDSVFEGDTVTFTVQVRNLGPLEATNVRIDDALPTGLTFVDGSTTQGFFNGGSGLWSVGSLAAGAGPQTLTLRAAVDPGTAGRILTNVARSRGLTEQRDPNPANDTARVSVTVGSRGADLSVTKTVDPATPAEGDTVGFTVTIQNLGPSNATSVQVLDTLVTGFTFVSAGTTQGAYDPGTGVWNVGSVASGTTHLLFLTLSVDAGTAGQTLVNTALVSQVDQADPDPTNDMAVAAVTPVLGALRWQGGVSTDWSAGANWAGGVAPASTDTVLIPTGTPNSPVLTASDTVGAITVENGAVLTVDTLVTLTVTGDVSAGNTITGPGTVSMTGTGATVQGTVPNLTVRGSVTASGTLLVNRNLVVTGSGASFDPVAQSVSVMGGLTTQSSGLFAMSDPAGTVDVLGNATFQGASQTTPFLTGGTLRIGGDFSQANCCHTFVAGGTHTTVFNGSTLQTVTFGTPSLTQSRFQNLTIDNTAGVALGSNIAVSGDASVNNGTLTGADFRADIAGSLSDASGGWQPLTTGFTGDPSLPATLNTNVEFTGAASLSNSFNVNGNLTVTGSGAVLNLGTANVAVSGSFTTTSGGLLEMDQGAALLAVAGNATFQGRSQTTPFLTAGTLRIGGNLTQSGCCHTLVAGGTHTTILDGSAQQTITFGTPNLTQSRFQNLEIDNTAGVVLGSNIAISGNATVTNGALTGAGFATDIAGNLTDAAGGNWNPGTTRFTQNPTLPTLIDSNVEFTGAATLGGDVSLVGNLTVTGSSAVLNLGAQRVDVTGNFVTTSSGLLEMDQPAAELNVQGGALFQGRSQTTAFLIDGTLRVAGSLAQVGCCHTFVAGGSHTTILNGTTQQSVNFGTPDLAQSRFQNLVIDNTAGVALTSNIAVSGDVTVTNGTVTGSGIRTDIAGNLTDAQGDRWSPSTTRFTGSPMLPGSLTTNVEITGAATLANSFTINGNLTVTGSGAVLNLGSQQVLVTGNFQTASSGLLEMDQPAAQLAIAGSATFQGRSQTTPFLTDGLLIVDGDFAQIGCCHTFVAGGSHTTRFNGTTQQSVNFGTPDLTQSRFQNLEIDNTAGVVITSNIAVSGNATVTNGTLGGASFRTDIAGNLSDAAGGNWNPGTTRFTQSPTLPTLIDSNVEFTGPATLVGDLSVVGNLTVTGSAAVLNLGAQRVDVTGGFETVSSGLLEMDQSTAQLNVDGNATFQGRSQTTPSLTGGTLRIRGNFTQVNCCHTFVAGGTHTTIFDGTTQQTITFGTGSPTQSRFNNLQITNALASTLIGGDLAVAGTFSAAAGVSLVPNGATPRTLTITGEVNQTQSMSVSDVAIVLDGATLTAFDNVAFGSFDPSLTQLTVRHPGAAIAFNFNALSFSTTPTSGVGAYLEAEDTDTVSPFLTINMISTSPSSATSPDVVTVGGAVVFWPGG